MAKKSNPKLDDSTPASVTTSRDELSQLIHKNLLKEFKEHDEFVWFLDTPDDAPTTVTAWIPTGNSLLDLAISNRPHGGVPCGKITELTGLEASGKSLLAAHLLAETQKLGGVAVYIDTESAVSSEFLEAIGVNLKSLLYLQLETVENIFKSIESIITSIRNSSKDRLVTIVVDSLAGASTEVEMEADYSKDGYATTKAILLSKAMRKITNLIAKQKIALVFTNQLRMKMQAMAFADPYTTSGGKAVGFHSTVRIRLSSTGKIKNGDEIVGNKIKAQIIKNRVGPPFRVAEFELYYDSGLDNYGSWLSVLADNKILNKSGAYYTPSEDGTPLQGEKFMAKDFKALLEAKPEVKEYLYNQLCDNMIMKYKTAGEVRIDDDLKVDSNDFIGEE